MIEILNKIFFRSNNFGNLSIEFQELRSKTGIELLFRAVEGYSDKSEIRYVGGCVRKILKNEKVNDIDLATNLTPNQIIEVCKKENIKFYETGLKHGTITAIINDHKFEITSLREDLKTDGRHAEIVFTNDWKKDASRRDFSINSIYSDLQGNIFDPFNGKKDLNKGLIEFIGDPATRIKEDYLRILRYIRFFLGYSKNQHKKNTVKIIKQHLSGLKQVSKERQLEELKKIIFIKSFNKINSDKVSKEIFLLIFPELKHLNKINKLDDLSNDILKKKSFAFILSLLLIDKTEDCDYFIYKYNLSNKEKDKIKHLNLIFSEEQKKDFFSKENLSKILLKNGKENLVDILDYKILTTKKNKDYFVDLKKYFVEFNIPVMPVKAKDLIEKFNLKEGRLLGSILKEIEDHWLNNNFKISNDKIEDIVKSKRI